MFASATLVCHGRLTIASACISKPLPGAAGCFWCRLEIRLVIRVLSRSCAKFRELARHHPITRRIAVRFCHQRNMSGLGSGSHLPPESQTLNDKLQRALQSNTGLSVIERPLAKQARIDDLLKRPCWHNHGRPALISGPMSIVALMALVRISSCFALSDKIRRELELAPV